MWERLLDDASAHVFFFRGSELNILFNNEEILTFA